MEDIGVSKGSLSVGIGIFIAFAFWETVAPWVAIAFVGPLLGVDPQLPVVSREGARAVVLSAVAAMLVPVMGVYGILCWCEVLADLCRRRKG